MNFISIIIKEWVTQLHAQSRTQHEPWQPQLQRPITVCVNRQYATGLPMDTSLPVSLVVDADVSTLTRSDLVPSNSHRKTNDVSSLCKEESQLLWSPTVIDYVMDKFDWCRQDKRTCCSYDFELLDEMDSVDVCDARILNYYIRSSGKGRGGKRNSLFEKLFCEAAL